MATLASLTVGLDIDTDPVVQGARRASAAIRSIGRSVSGMTQDAEGNWRDLEGNILSAAHANMTEGQRIRDALGGIGQSLLGVGRISRQVLNQGLIASLRTAGNVGPKVLGGLAKSFGVMSVGAIGAAGAMAAVPLAILGIGVAAAAQSAEVKSAFADLKTHVTGTMQELAKPLVKPLADAAKQMQGIFDDIAPQLGKMFEAAATMIEPLVEGLGNLVKGIMPGFVAVMEDAGPLVEGLAEGLGSLGEGIGGFFEGLSSGIGEAGGVFESLFGAIGSILPVLGQLMGQMLAVAGPILSKLFDALGPVIAQLGAALMLVIQALGPVLDQLVMAFLALLEAVLPILPPILQLVAALLPALMPLIAALVPVFGALGEVVAALVPIIEFLTPIVAELARIFSEHLGAFLTGVVVPALEAVAALLRGDFDEALEYAKTAVKNAGKWILDTFEKLPEQIGEALSALPGVLKQAAVISGNAFLRTVKGTLDNCVKDIKALPERAKQATMGMAGVLVSAGRDLIRGFINGIKSMLGSVRSTLGDLTNSLTSWKGPESLDKKILTPNGQMVIGGFMRGIASQVPALRKQLGVLTADLPGMTAAITPAGVSRASSSQRNDLRLDVTGADEDMKRLIRRIVKNDGRGDVQTAFGR